MDFFEAMQALKEGKKVRNKEWPEKTWIKFCTENYYFIDESGRNWEVCYDQEDEWEIYDDKKQFILNIVKGSSGYTSLNYLDLAEKGGHVMEVFWTSVPSIWIGPYEKQSVLTQEMVRELLPYLNRFVEIGRLEK